MEESFGSYRFNRTLWNEWNQEQIRQAQDTDNNEELIAGQVRMIEEIGKENKVLQEKLNNAERISERLRADNQQLRKDLSETKKQNGSDKETSNKATEKDYNDRLDILSDYLKKLGKEAAVLFLSHEEWADVLTVLRRDLLERIYDKYKYLFNARKKSENPTRREDVLGMLYCFNREGSGFIGNDDSDVLLYYPKNDQIYDNEYRNLVLDALWDDEDVFLNRIASDNDYMCAVR